MQELPEIGDQVRTQYGTAFVEHVAQAGGVYWVTVWFEPEIVIPVFARGLYKIRRTILPLSDVQRC
jgi:hypothetical protein